MKLRNYSRIFTLVLMISTTYPAYYLMNANPLDGSTSNGGSAHKIVESHQAIFPKPFTVNTSFHKTPSMIRRTLPPHDLSVPKETQGGPVEGPHVSETPAPQRSPDPPGDFVAALNRTVLSTGTRGSVDEPSVANSGDTVFYTGNWYCARSIDAGATWQFCNPYEDMHDPRIMFVDANSNGVWDPGETVVYDSNANGVYDTGEPVIAGATSAQGTTLSFDPRIGFVDSNANTLWDPGESVVYDTNSNTNYDPGEPVIAGTVPCNGPPTSGCSGTGLQSDFCCDQDTIYVPDQKLFAWYRQGRQNPGGSNYFRLCVSPTAANWQCFDMTPTNLNSGWIQQWFDYPQLGFSDNFLYVTTNIFDNSNPKAYQRTVIIRFPFSSLTTGGGPSSFQFVENGAITVPVQGALNVMYLGSQVFYFPGCVAYPCLRIHSWPDSSKSPNIDDLLIPWWSLTRRGEAHCPGPDRGDICSRFDDRILSGWVSPFPGGEEVIGFTWNVKQGNSFPWPYTYVIRAFAGADYPVATSNGPQIAIETSVWNSAFAWVYSAVAPQGDHLAMVAFTAGTSMFPSLNAAIVDDFSSGSLFSEVHLLVSGCCGPPTAGETVVYDTNNNGVFDAGDIIIAGGAPSTPLSLKSDPKIRYIETDGNTVWDPGESVVYDTNGNGKYDTGEPVIAGAIPPAGTSLQSDSKIKFIDSDGDGVWSDCRCWGDYLRIHPYYGSNQGLWAASGYVWDATKGILPRYFVFGRARDFFNFTLSFSGPLQGEAPYPTVPVVRGGNSAPGAGCCLNVTLTTGPIGYVNLSCSGLPLDATCSFNPPYALAYQFTSKITFTTSYRTPKGSYTITVTGTGGGQKHSVTLTLAVLDSSPAPGYTVMPCFTLSGGFVPCTFRIPHPIYCLAPCCPPFCGPAPAVAASSPNNANTSATSNIVVSGYNGWTQNVSLTGTWAGSTPTQIVFSLKPTVVRPLNGTVLSTLNVTIGQGSVVGNYTLRIFLQGGNQTQELDYVISVQPPPPNSPLWPKSFPAEPIGFSVPMNYYTGTSRGYGSTGTGGQGFWIVGAEASRSGFFSQPSNVTYNNGNSAYWVISIVWDSNGRPIYETAFAPSGTPNGWNSGTVLGCSNCVRMDIYANKILWGSPDSIEEVAGSPSTETLNWGSGTLGSESNFLIERRTGLTGSYEQIASVSTNVTQYLDSGLTPSTTYYYRIRAYNAVLNATTAYSGEARTGTYPATWNLTTTVGFGSGSVPNCSCVASAGYPTTIYETPAAGWSFGGWWTSGVSCQAGPASNPCSFIMPNNPVILRASFADATPPKWLAASSLNASTITPTSVTLDWAGASDNVGVARYTVYWGPLENATKFSVNVGATTTSVVSGLNPGTAYSFRVAAVDAAGNQALGPSTILETHWPNSQFRFDWADYNNDGTINIVDLSSMAACFGSTNTTADWAKCKYWDFTLQNKTNIVDLVLIAVQFGTTITGPYPGQNSPVPLLDPLWFRQCSTMTPMDAAYCQASQQSNQTPSPPSPEPD